MTSKAKPGKEFWTRERCYITELLNSPDQAEVSIARARVASGVTTELHSLSVREWYVIESGEGEVSVENESDRRVQYGDVVTISKHHSQKIRNSGATDLIFLCVCVPRFSPDDYTPLE
jgi:mannose-6-phosphate isomerase-like protein (cupin superfamily)